tara:strand:+ start:1382 stop:2539 length:1158 start_codon:yes stop_codon:yes gene_type:complete
MAQTNFWQQIWQRGQNKFNTGPEPLDPETEANLRNRGLITDKGQTFDPDRPNYIGPSHTGKSPTSLAGDAVLIAASAATVRKPTWALEALGALTANPGDFSDQALYNIDRLRLQQALGNQLRGAKVVANTVLDIAKSELSPGLRLAGAGADVPVNNQVMQIRTDPSKGVWSPPKSNKPPEFGIGPQTLPMPDKVWKPKHVLKRYKDQLKQRGYTYVEKVSPDGTLKGGPKAKFGGQDFDLKWNEANAKGERTLKVKAKSSRLEEAAKRTSREKPWIRKKYEIQEILTKHGHSDKADSLINLIKKQYQSKVNLIKKDGLTIGHHKALENGGWDVAENIGGEIGKGKGGNYARGFRNDPPDAVLQQKGAFTGSLEEYVLFKLPEVLK